MISKNPYKYIHVNLKNSNLQRKQNLFIIRNMKKEEEILNNINGYPLDESQRQIVKSKDKYLLVSAGAGSGKTLTIIGKIRYLIEIEKLKENEIICISFTNEATNNLKNKLKENYNYNVPCYTFHKLGLEILKNENYKITDSNLLNYTINEYLTSIIDNKNKQRLLEYFKIKYNSKNFESKYNNINKEYIDRIKSLIETFINLLKSNDYNENNIIEFINKEKKSKNKNLLIIILYIYKLYEQELKSSKEIDFSDMISLATKKVNKEGYKNKIKYIIIDEFQDTSWVRFNLIKAILSKTNASLLVVGDDFQSIYRFTGCDLTLFLNFENIFPNSKTMKIENTYRNSQELIDVAGSFIMKNNNQIKKNLKSNKSIKKPIEIIYYQNIEKTFIKTIEKIYKETNKPILVLGRNNYDINILTRNDKFVLQETELIYKNNKNINLKYLTIHKSKGLEEENVVIINLTNKTTGFPNKITDHKILSYVKCKEDNYPYAEERRLMYVALTRTKNKVYLLVSQNNSSIFAKELTKHYKKKIKIKKA